MAKKSHYTATEVAVLLGYSRQTIGDFIKRGIIKAIQLERFCKIPQSELDKISNWCELDYTLIDNDRDNENIKEGKKDHYTVSEVAKLLGYTELTIISHINKGNIKTIKPFKTHRIPQAELDKFSNGCELDYTLIAKK